MPSTDFSIFLGLNRHIDKNVHLRCPKFRSIRPHHILTSSHVHIYNTPAAPLAGVNIGGAGSYVYDTPANNNQSVSAVDSAAKSEEKRVFVTKPPSKGGSKKN